MKRRIKCAFSHNEIHTTICICFTQRNWIYRTWQHNNSFSFFYNNNNKKNDDVFNGIPSVSLLKLNTIRTSNKKYFEKKKSNRHRFHFHLDFLQTFDST